MKLTLKRISLAALLIAASAALPTTAGAVTVFNDSFESYTLGNANGQGLWIDFGGDLQTNIVNTQANGGTQSIEFGIEAVPAAANQYGSDSTYDLPSPITSGQLVFSMDIFYPTGFTGKSNTFLSRGRTNTPDFNFDLGMNILGDGNSGLVGVEGVGSTTPLLRDQWVAVMVNIDLDADTTAVSYGGVEIFTGAWNRGGANPTQYQGINIWANGDLTSAPASAFYVDNLQLVAVPEPTGAALLGAGLLGLMGRRRRA